MAGRSPSADACRSVAADADELPDRRHRARVAFHRGGERSFLGAIWIFANGNGAAAGGHERQRIRSASTNLGGDVFSRVVHGSHIVILLSLSGTFLGLVIGAIIGLLSGYVGGWFDEILQRLLEASSVFRSWCWRLSPSPRQGRSFPATPWLVVLVVALVYAPQHRPHGTGGGDRHCDARLCHGSKAAR